jgi:hypothetical protein
VELVAGGLIAILEEGEGAGRANVVAAAGTRLETVDCSRVEGGCLMLLIAHVMWCAF